MLATLLAEKLIGGTWGMVPGMFGGMVLGMFAALLVSIFLVPVLGIMETMVSCMLSGMLGGMVGGMWALDFGDWVRWGIGIGLSIVVLVYALNFAMSGPQDLEN
jgi:hypothetical protein